MPLTKGLFESLSKCPAEYFEMNHERILKREVSLKEVILNSERIGECQKIKAEIAKEAEVESFTALKQLYPDKINDDVVTSFAGAVTMGKKKNLKGILLKRFVKGLNNESVDECVKAVEIESINDFGCDKIVGFDVLVYNLLSDQQDYIDTVIDAVGVQRKDYLAVLIVLHSDREQRRVISKLEYWNTESSIEVLQVLFENNKDPCKQKEMIKVNVQYAVLFGKFQVFNPPLSVLNGEFRASLKHVIANISPPSSKIALVQAGNQDIVKIHDDDDLKGCTYTYVAPKQSLDKFLLNHRMILKQQEDIATGDDVEFEVLQNPSISEDAYGTAHEQPMEKQSSTSKM